MDEGSREEILRVLMVLQEFGPRLGRPYVDTVKQSRHANMKELRVQHKRSVLRIFFAFDPKRQAVLLIGGDKRGDKRFYERMIPLADRLFDDYLSGLE